MVAHQLGHPALVHKNIFYLAFAILVWFKMIYSANYILIFSLSPRTHFSAGKTETTKDLAKGLGMMVYVFNCCEQMDFR